jgi:hypothetical protein
LGYDELPSEILLPRRSYHPTSRYRMALALYHRLGPAGFEASFHATP